MEILKIAAALLNIGFGLFAFFQPRLIAESSGFALHGALGRAETRISFGGYFIGMGVAALILNEQAAYQLLGAGWLTAGIVRVITMFIEDRSELIAPKWWILLASEIGVGLILLA